MGTFLANRDAPSRCTATDCLDLDRRPVGIRRLLSVQLAISKIFAIFYFPMGY